MSEQKNMSVDEAVDILQDTINDIVETDEKNAPEPAEKYGVLELKFKEPFSFQGKTYEKLTFDFGKLTLNDSLAVEDELAQLGKGSLMPEWNSQYLVRIAAKACTDKIGSDALMALPLPEGRRILNQTRNFIRR